MRIVKIYAAQLVDALAYLQKKRVMHRDLKPLNIMLDDNFNIKLVSVVGSFTKANIFQIDFGEAKQDEFDIIVEQTSTDEETKNEPISTSPV